MGIKDALRSTQEYPTAFAAAIADLHIADLHEKEAMYSTGTGSY